MKTEDFAGLEEYITQFPVFEYRMIQTGDLSFASRVRTICREECERYGTTWACPPGVGTLEECRDRCMKYPQGFFFSSVAQVDDIMNMQQMLDTRQIHEEITAQIGDYIESLGYECYTLSTESCAICEKCTYPDAPCRHPHKMHPCLESHGVVVSEIVEANEMTYDLGGNTILWFSLILLNANNTGI